MAVIFLNIFIKKPESDLANPLRKLKKVKLLSFNERLQIKFYDGTEFEVATE